MCDVCLKSPCDSRCPNAPETPVACTCDNCGEPIRIGDEYYREAGGENLCMSCVDNMGTFDLLHHFGCNGVVAEVYQ